MTRIDYTAVVTIEVDVDGRHCKATCPFFQGAPWHDGTLLPFCGLYGSMLAQRTGEAPFLHPACADIVHQYRAAERPCALVRESGSKDRVIEWKEKKGDD